MQMTQPRPSAFVLKARHRVSDAPAVFSVAAQRDYFFGGFLHLFYDLVSPESSPASSEWQNCWRLGFNELLLAIEDDHSFTSLVCKIKSVAAELRSIWPCDDVHLVGGWPQKRLIVQFDNDDDWPDVNFWVKKELLQDVVDSKVGDGCILVAFDLDRWRRRFFFVDFFPRSCCRDLGTKPLKERDNKIARPRIKKKKVSGPN